MPITTMEKAATEPASAVPACYTKNGRKTWHQRRRHHAVLALLRRVQGSVLDYGCGYGDLTYAMSHHHLVQGVDVDPTRIAFAQREYGPIPFHQCDSDRVPFADGTFDIVTSIAVIHFSPSPEGYLREAWRVLRADGHLLIACINEPVLRNAARRALGREPLLGRVWMCSAARMRQMLKENGFIPTVESCFYDPPFAGWKNGGDVFFGAIQQICSVLHVRKTANYYLILARKVS